MCYHNFILHNGCGHKNPCHGSKQYTLCEKARQRLPPSPGRPRRTENRTPPPPPPKDTTCAGALTASPEAGSSAARHSMDVGATGRPQKRASLLEKRASRLQKLGAQYIRRIPTISGHSKSHSVSLTGGRGGSGAESGSGGAGLGSGPVSPPLVTSPFEEYAGVSPLDIATALCEGSDLKVVQQREEKVDVCERCKRVINEMRWLVQAYDEKKNIKGCRAYWYVDMPREDDEGSNWLVKRGDRGKAAV